MVIYDRVKAPFTRYRKTLAQPTLLTPSDEESSVHFGRIHAILSDPECRVLAFYCSGHPAATCEDCRRDYKFTELGVEVVRRRYYFCPSCRLDLVDQLRLHVLHCRGIAAVLEERISRSKQRMKESDGLKTASAVLAAESHERAKRVLDMKRTPP